MTLNVFRTIKPIAYKSAYQQQLTLHQRRVTGEIPDTIWLLEHPPVLTIGIRRNQRNNILIDPVQMGIEVVETDRGGEVTYHGPGQLVGYVFIGIDKYAYRIKDFIHRLETVFIDYLWDCHGIEARHDSKHTGVWVGMDKITAIGIAIRQKVTLHGFAFNINTDVSHYKWIIPCGISEADRGITSLEKLLGYRIDIADVASVLTTYLRKSLGFNSGFYSIRE